MWLQLIWNKNTSTEIISSPNMRRRRKAATPQWFPPFLTSCHYTERNWRIGGIKGEGWMKQENTFHIQTFIDERQTSVASERWVEQRQLNRWALPLVVQYKEEWWCNKEYHSDPGRRWRRENSKKVEKYCLPLLMHSCGELPRSLRNQKQCC